MSICICSAVSVSPLASLKSTLSRMVLSAANSAISASASLPSDIWPLGTRAFALANMTSRHHSPKVLPPAWAVSSSLAYSSSVTFVPMDFVRRDGLTIKFSGKNLTPHRGGIATLPGKGAVKMKRFAVSLMLVVVLGAITATGRDERQVTAREVVADIQKQVGVEWDKDTVDTFKAGDPDTPVKGIAVTMMATMDVLERASAKGLNFVITHEPTFYAHLDTPEGLPESDPVWTEKRAFIEKHGMVVWRFHDHWHMRRPDGIEAGNIRALGWEKFQRPDNQYLFAIPETTLKELAREVATKLGSPVLRVVGDPEMKVSKVGFSPGAAGSEREIRALEQDDVQ